MTDQELCVRLRQRGGWKVAADRIEALAADNARLQREAEKAEAIIAGLEAERDHYRKRADNLIQPCENCGGDWLQTGLEVECPCRLKAENERLTAENERLTTERDAMLRGIGALNKLSELRGAK